MKRLLAPIMFALALAMLWPASASAQDVVVVTGDITESVTWVRENTYVLSGAVFVREPATLTIEAGTLVVGEFATTGTLVIDRGAKIVAIGTRRRPIIFTSDQPEGTRERGFWGGLVINGRAPTNNGLQEGEGGTGIFGGTVKDDNSGILRYVRVEFAGIEFSPDNELNGIAFQGVGSGTVLEYIQVHMNLDDGIEFFGGTANGKYFVITWCADDSLDWTDGWVGSVQYVIIQQRGDDADQGIEADNNGENNNKTPRSSPTLYNFTIIGDPDSTEGDESDVGVLLREGTAGLLRNFVVVGFKEWGVQIDGPATWRQARTGELSFANSVFFNNGAGLARDGARVGTLNFSNELGDGESNTTEEAMTGQGRFSDDFTNNIVRNPRLRGDEYELDANIMKVVPAGKSPLLPKNGAVVAEAPAGNAFIDDADFLGAVGRGAANNWPRGWVRRPKN